MSLARVSSWSRGVRGDADPQVQSQLCPAADIRRAAEAKLIALACAPAPEGFARWTLRLLEEKVVESNIVDKASDNTIGRTLKKTLLNRTAGAIGIPPEANSGFVAAMEDVLETYQKPRDPDRPLVCLTRPLSN